MTIEQQFFGKYLLMVLKGRLDAAWSDYVQETLMKQIRSGHHHLLLDARDLSFLSSAGIRTLMIVARELSHVKGTFSVLKASPFVEKTIRLTGLGQWLAEDLPEEIKGTTATTADSQTANTEMFLLDQGSGMVLWVPAAWQPWQQISNTDLHSRIFPVNTIALGIGSASETTEEAMSTLGDFLAVAGHVVYQLPEKRLRPDYLIQKQDYIPGLQVVQLIEATGKLTHHFRFAPDGAQASFGIAALANKALRMVRSRTAVMVLVAEIHGLVGASLARSPAQASDIGINTYPEIREWVTFSGEPLFQGQHCLVAGFVSDDPVSETLLFKPLPAFPGLYGHFHAAVFPYQSLPNGQIDLTATLREFFNGPPPLALLHLIDDQRPIQGTGESTFIRGACWCAPAKKQEVIS